MSRTKALLFVMVVLLALATFSGCGPRKGKAVVTSPATYRDPLIMSEENRAALKQLLIEQEGKLAQTTIDLYRARRVDAENAAAREAYGQIGPDFQDAGYQVELLRQEHEAARLRKQIEANP